MSEEQISGLIKKEYAAGFYTEIESDTLAPGLNEEVIAFISAKKNEPEWMLEWRLEAYRAWLKMEEPEWAHVDYPKVDYQALSYYSAPKSMGDKPKSLDEVDPEHHHDRAGNRAERDVETPNHGEGDSREHPVRHRIAEELGAEPRTEEIVSTRLGNRYFKPLAGIAVAASVAIIAIVGLQQTNAPTADAEAVADSSTYTQPPADSRLDEMFRLHDASGSVGNNSMLTEFVTLEINEEDLVKVEPQAEFVVPSESDDEEDDEATVTETGEADLQAN